MSVDTVISPPQPHFFGFQYQRPRTPPFADPAGVQDLETEEQTQGPNSRKRKLSPNLSSRAQSRDGSIFDPVTPKRQREMDEPDPSPKKPISNPYAKACAAKAFEKWKWDRNRQWKERHDDAFATRHRMEMEEAARQFHANQARQREEEARPRKWTKPKVKHPDDMSWTETPQYSHEDLYANQQPYGFQQPSNGGFPPYQPAYNPHTGFAPGFGPPPQPPFNQYQGFTPQPGSAPFGGFFNQAGPSQEEAPDTDDIPESSPTPRASPEPEGSRHPRWQSEPAYSDHEEARRQAALEESMRKMWELNQDKPIWEEAARERRAQEERDAREAEARRQQREQARAEAEYARSQAQAQQRFEDE